jgi:FMN reductase
MSVLLIAGSPAERSRSAALLDEAGRRLKRRGALVERLHIRNLSPQALLLADLSHPSISSAVRSVANAEVVVVATPVYKAAYSGVLKVFLDLLSQAALQGKTVLPLATGGSANHMLALDYALRPVLQSLGAKHILSGIYATDAQVTPTSDGKYQLNHEISTRLDEAVNTLITESLRPVLAPAGQFASVAFSQVRCSV